MRRIVQALAACVLTAIVIIASFVAGGSASARVVKHPVHLTAVQLKLLSSGHTFVFTEKDRVGGKNAGYDSVRCHYSAQQQQSLCDGVFARVKGLTYFHITVDSEGRGAGRITGGTGAYLHSSGTVNFVGISHTRSRFTLVYN